MAAITDVWWALKLSITMTDHANVDSAPLPLSTLTKWVSPQTLSWLQHAQDIQLAQSQTITDDDMHYTASLFQSDADKEEELLLQQHRIRSWKTSTTNPDGIFDCSLDANDGCNNKNGIRVLYIISDSSEGHGNTLWPSSRHISNLLADAESCRDLLSPLLQREPIDDSNDRHPLLNQTFVELGAGAGVPSWIAMRCGARVVCTDQCVPDRIRCIAECAERNYRDMIEMGCSGENLENAKLTFVCPYNWGESIEEVTKTSSLGPNEKFDVLVAADCCYMPLLQTKLLQSIDMLLSEVGVALLPFALHGNASDQEVWGILDRAEKLGFVAEVLEERQLTPSVIGMEDKRSLVQTVRLTRHIKP